MASFPVYPRGHLSGIGYLRAKLPVIYAWKRNGEYLYIGATTTGLNRLLYHNIINKMETVLETDEFEFWYVPEEEIWELESQMIQKHNPKYNGIKNEIVGCELIICLNPSCRKEFKQKRPWQKYCTVKCQQGRK